MRKVDPVKHEERRKQILEAAGRCFMRDGFRGASTSDICAEAKISPGHLYHYFPSKEAIVGAMVESGLAQAADMFGRIKQGPDLVGAFLAKIDRGKGSHDRSKQLLMLDILTEAGRNPAIAGIVRDHSREARKLLSEFLVEGQQRGEIDGSLDANTAAALLLSVVDGTKTLVIREPKLDLGKAIDMLKLLIGRFLAPPPGPITPKARK